MRAIQCQAVSAAMTAANEHSLDCDWQFDQYPHECNCGAITGKIGTKVIDQQLFNAMYQTLLRKQITFEHYAQMHSAKHTGEGKAKAERNQRHADDIRKVLNAVLDQPGGRDGER